MRDARSYSITRRFAGVVVLAGLLGACDDDGDPSGPIDEPFSTLTVAAPTDWAYVDLASTARQVTPTNPQQSNAWDIAFLATSVMLNGGQAGAGDVEGYCLCQNQGATNDQVLAMTAESERAAFEAVTAASIPSDDGDWVSDELSPSITGWWNYDMTSHTLTPATDRVWVVRTAEGDAFAKLRVTGITNATQQNAGEVTLEFATQTAGEAYGATRTLTVDVSSGPVYVDLLDGAVSDEDDWDLLLEGFDIRLNGGVSGAGQARAVLAGDDFATVPGGADISGGWASDAFGGVFDETPWYRYNLQGNHQIWPTYDVYLIRSGSDVFKVQIVSYYNATDGAARHITFRYAPLTD